MVVVSDSSVITGLLAITNYTFSKTFFTTFFSLLQFTQNYPRSENTTTL
ncbi:hypothetical protein IMPERIA89_530093 [Imperialibacter sp. 89]|nr:hypothetical protein IMPERIA75_130083 [Imperialibacter sp. 75]CAD5286442.1 hypothetical protein IMPERIA89_530093 [Imperialibacter sp. 89]